MTYKLEPSPLVEQPIVSREFERFNQSKLLWKGDFRCSSYSSVYQSKMTTDLKQLCFELIEMQPFLDENELVEYLSGKLARYASDMSAVNLRILSEIVAEKMPALANDVTVPFPKEHQRSLLGAIQLIKRALRKSQKQLNEERDGIDERLNLSHRMGRLHHSLAVFENYFQRSMVSGTNQEDQLVSTLSAISKDERLSESPENLQLNDLTDNEDPNLKFSLKRQEPNNHLSTEVRRQVQDVIRSKQRVSWLDQRNPITLEFNNHSGVDLYTDIECGRLVDNLTQNLPRYSDYIEEKSSALVDYVEALEAFLPNAKLFGMNIMHQVESIVNESKKQLNYFNEIKAHCHSVQKVFDTKVLLRNKLTRIDTMLDHSIVSIKKRLNLHGFLAFLPELRTNNEKVRKLVNERNELQSTYDKQEVVFLKSKIGSLNADIQQLDDEYEKRVLELKQFDYQAKKSHGYPCNNGDTLETWSTWVKQNVAGELSGDYRPDINMLFLERQMAHAGIRDYAISYQSLFAPLSSGEVVVRQEVVKNALLNLHHWALYHPIESQAFAGNLNNIFEIMSTNSDIFGPDVTSLVSTIWYSGEVQSQVKDIVQNRRVETLKLDHQSLSPEMIALMHLAYAAPFMAAAMRELCGSSRTINGAGLLVSALIPNASFDKSMASLLEEIVQAWCDDTGENIGMQYQMTSVMVDALMKAIGSQGSFKERAQTMVRYANERKALQDVEVDIADCFESNHTNMIRLSWRDLKNTWCEMNNKQRALILATVPTLSITTSAFVAFIVTTIIGTESITSVTLAIAGLCAMLIGGFFAKTTANFIATRNFWCMNNVYSRARMKLTQKRIDNLLHRLGEKTNNSCLVQLLGDSIKDKGKLLNLVNMPIEQQSQALQGELVSAARILSEKLDSRYKQIQEKDITLAQSLTGNTIEKSQWYECYDDVQKFIVKYAAS
ncbi:hypothetical protein [Vibrio aquimaris]|uniref:Uncharacterized protein n=1 Tax=Vibrio aquimaris TaxID=2587862 RepID=A0A5P9CJN9_9VIBR|nr:hypothetical protein [Vibrio aquimaris]QFT26231.1 hypothetical protein FIV01_07305 [Vibrio aquimaris]